MLYRLRSDEQGDIVGSWLLQLLVIMAIVGLIIYEFVAVAVTTVNLEDDARQVAVAAADAYGSQEQLDDATAAADAEADGLDIELQEVRVDGELIRVTVRAQAPTLVLHRIGPLANITRPSTDGRSNWRV